MWGRLISSGMSSPDGERDPTALAGALLAELRALACPANVEGMARYGISRTGTLGVPVACLRPMARDLLGAHRRDGALRHAVAEALWGSGVHEARILAALLEDPALVTRAQAERWAADLDSWDVCDQLCNKLLWRCPHAGELALAWAERTEPFVKRAAFVLMATLAVHADLPEAEFDRHLALAEREAGDGRNFVKKAVSWAIRQQGKRGGRRRARALVVARRLARQESPAARWVAREVLRELRASGR